MTLNGVIAGKSEIDSHAPCSLATQAISVYGTMQLGRKPDKTWNKMETNILKENRWELGQRCKI